MSEKLKLSRTAAREAENKEVVARALRILDDPSIGLCEPVALDAAQTVSNLRHLVPGAIEGVIESIEGGNDVIFNLRSDDHRLLTIPVLNRPGILFLRIFDPLYGKNQQAAAPRVRQGR